MRAAEGPAAEIADRVAAGVEMQNARLVAALEEGIAEGQVRDVDPQRTATALWAMLNGLLALSWRADRLRTTPAETTELLAEAIEILHLGLQAEVKPDISSDVDPR